VPDLSRNARKIPGKADLSCTNLAHQNAFGRDYWGYCYCSLPEQPSPRHPTSKIYPGLSPAMAMMPLLLKVRPQLQLTLNPKPQ
jgi:hypothetical protein